MSGCGWRGGWEGSRAEAVAAHAGAAGSEGLRPGASQPLSGSLVARGKALDPALHEEMSLHPTQAMPWPDHSPPP